MKYLLLTLIFLTTQAYALTIADTIPQGGLLEGKVPAGSSVTINGLSVPVTADGTFLTAAGRNAQGALNIVVKNNNQVTGKKIPITNTEWQVEKINGLNRKYVEPDPKVIARIKADNRQIGAARRKMLSTAYFKEGFIKPVQATRISGVFGSQRILNGTPKSPHKGVDFAAPTGTPVVAPAAGVVTMVLEDAYYTGGTFIVDHGHGLSTVYAHMHTIDVVEGQQVAQGEKLGTVGSTGRSTGPHLHFGATLRQVHFDPMWLFD